MYVYLHGFASSPLSNKGVLLREALASRDVPLDLPDLNHPSFEEQTYSGLLELIDRLLPRDRPSRLLGSSMGAYLATRFAEIEPERVESLFLLCPAFDLPARWPRLLGERAMRQWREVGFTPVADCEGQMRALPWSFVEDSRLHPAYPAVECPVRIVHGTGDEVVPIEYSRRFADRCGDVELVEVPDDHSLAASFPTIRHEAFRFFRL